MKTNANRRLTAPLESSPRVTAANDQYAAALRDRNHPGALEAAKALRCALEAQDGKECGSGR